MAILTINHSINQANNFLNDVKNTRNAFYVFLGKPTPWSNGTPVVDDSLSQIELTTYRDLLYGKLISASNIQATIAAYNWSNGNVYSAYDQDSSTLYDSQFYVVTPSYDVFKCIDNNSNAQSTIMPTLTSTSGTFLTGDGYMWKYMFTVDPAANSKFTTTGFIPLTPNSEVQNNAVSGTIDVIRLIDGGSNYQVFESGELQNVINSTTLRIAANSSAYDNYYTGSSIYLTTGRNSGQLREIVSSNGSQKTVSVSASNPFVIYSKLDLDSISNPLNIISGQIVSQPIDYCSFLYSSGYFNINDTVVQTDTGVSGVIVASNSSILQINRNNQSLSFNNTLPIRTTVNDGTIKAGNVSISNVGTLAVGVITYSGSGYSANASVSVIANDAGSGGQANAHANSSGKLDSLLIAAGGNNYFLTPNVVISNPANTTFNSQTAVYAGISNNYDSNCLISLATSQYFVANDVVIYYRSTSNTANIGLISGTSYYVQFANATTIALSTTPNGTRIQLSNTVPSETGHSIQGSTATGSIYPLNFLVTNAASSSGTQLNDSANGYSVGDYIRVGPISNTNFRRITSANSSLLIVDQSFKNTIGPTTHFKMTNVTDLTSVVKAQANGYIVDVDLNSLVVNIDTLLIPDETFIQGEQVKMVDSSNVYQSANGIVTFSNSSVIFLSAVAGTWTANLYAQGQSSQQKAHISTITSDKNVLIENTLGSFVLGQNVYFGSNAAYATLIGVSTLPSDQTEYIIGPTVTIDGDGTGAQAIGIVNNQIGSANNIIGVDMINPGVNYTYANVYFVANSNFGSNAQARAIISPALGHGADPMTELGGTYVSIYTKFDYSDDLTNFPLYTNFGKVGIIENPQFDNVLVTLKNFDRINFTLANTTSVGGWTSGEVVVQASTNAAGVVVTGNTTALQLKSVLGTFSNTGNSSIYGYYSNTRSQVVTANTIYFVPGNSPEIVSEQTANASAIVKVAYSNTSVLLGNVVGQFVYNDVMIDSSVNAYATVANIALSNGQRDVTTSFGTRFNDTSRITLTSNTGAYTLYETVIQNTTNASGTVISTNNEIDLQVNMSNVTTTFSSGQTITDTTTNANGIVTFANSTYIQLTSVSANLSFGILNTINNGLGITATTQNTYSVLLLNNVSGPYPFQGASTNAIIGQTSGSYGYCNSANLIINPDLVRDSGKVIYLENIDSVLRTQTSTEEVRIVIKF